jgi:hypothetical protein
MLADTESPGGCRLSMRYMCHVQGQDKRDICIICRLNIIWLHITQYSLRIYWMKLVGLPIEFRRYASKCRVIKLNDFIKIITVITPRWGRDNSVCVGTRHGLNGPVIDSWWRRQFHHPSTPAVRPTHPPVKCVLGLFPWGNAAWMWL